MPFSKETTGVVSIENHPKLLVGAKGRIDAAIVEAKSGKDSSPNKPWRDSTETTSAAYAIRFFGCFEEHRIETVAQRFMDSYRYEDDDIRIRFIVVAPEVDRSWRDKGVTYITFDDLADFLVDVRGTCWLQSGIGTVSVHSQWPKVIRDLFKILNDFGDTPEQRKQRVVKLLTVPPRQDLSCSI